MLWLWCYEFNVKLKSNPLSNLCFQELLQLNLCMFTIFIIKPEVAGTMTITQCLSSRDPIEKLSIYHSYASVSSSEDAGVGHDGDLCWVPCMALALWPDAECPYDVSECSREGVHLPRPTILGTRCKPVLPSPPTTWWGHLRWHMPILPTVEVPTDGESDSDTRLTLLFPRILILWSHPTRVIMWSLTHPSLFTLQWFAWLPTRLLLLQLLITCHPRFVVVGSFVPLLCPVDVGVLEEEDMVMLLPVVLGMVSSRPMGDVVIACGAKHKDSPFVCSYRVIILLYGMLGF